MFGQLEQEDQRLKKHYDRWMDIVRSVKLESCILTKLTKPFIPVNLVGPLYWVPASRGSILFLGVIRRHFLAAVVDPAVSLSTYSILPMEFGH